ncbi:hypothetical protein BH10ACT2_BH10ACT2_22040 [soil metagenome]
MSQVELVTVTGAASDLGPCSRCWRKLERLAVCRANDAEMGAIQGRDTCRSETFRDGDQAGVGSAEGQILVAVDEISDALPIG